MTLRTLLTGALLGLTLGCGPRYQRPVYVAPPQYERPAPVERWEPEPEPVTPTFSKYISFDTDGCDSQGRVNGRKDGKCLIGKKVPHFRTRDANPASRTYRKVISPRDYKGKVVVLNFWADWCGPCKKEMPEFEQVYRRSGGDVVILAQEAGSTEDKWNPHDPVLGVDISGLTYPILKQSGPRSRRGECVRVRKKSDRELKGWAVREECFSEKPNLPQTYIVDRRGIIRAFIGSAIDAQGLEQVIDRVR